MQCPIPEPGTSIYADSCIQGPPGEAWGLLNLDGVRTEHKTDTFFVSY